ncbi:hypothetical protein E2C01_000021 [Portunus trituberculatus]|uniref:Uncharacterized protein n=1 Tax=Portunus trituberculatus TaxID=210409 RepID=A0A5B7CD32_PORTR|nr:hypothetical protein [Portunus trituberculatus]
MGERATWKSRTNQDGGHNLLDQEILEKCIFLVTIVLLVFRSVLLLVARHCIPQEATGASISPQAVDMHHIPLTVAPSTDVVGDIRQHLLSLYDPSQGLWSFGDSPRFC